MHFYWIITWSLPCIFFLNLYYIEYSIELDVCAPKNVALHPGTVKLHEGLLTALVRRRVRGLICDLWLPRTMANIDPGPAVQWWILIPGLILRMPLTTLLPYLTGSTYRVHHWIQKKLGGQYYSDFHGETIFYTRLSEHIVRNLCW